MLRKIYLELAAIKRELRAIRRDLESFPKETIVAISEKVIRKAIRGELQAIRRDLEFPEKVVHRS